MINPEALRQQATNKYPEIVTALLRGENPFPVQLRYRRIKNTDTRENILHDIACLENQSQEKTGCGITIEWKEINTIRHGRNRVPSNITLATEEDFFGYTNKKIEFQRIRITADMLLTAFPSLKFQLPTHWRLLCNGDSAFWEKVVRVIHYFQQNPFPNLYIRELPIRIPTKFLETNKAVIEKLIAAVTPTSLHHEAETFEERLGLKTPDALIECRILDNALHPTWRFRQFTAMLRDIEHLTDVPAHTFLITENRTNFLTFPPTAGVIALHGKGYAVARLGQLSFLKKRRLIYWGDIDSHGFEILALLRRTFPQTESLMMDEKTWKIFSEHHGDGPRSRNSPEQFLPTLTHEEANLFQYVTGDNTQPPRRLEQEHISQSYANDCLVKLLNV